MVALVVTCALACSRSRRTPDDTLVMLVDGKINSLDPRWAATNNDHKVAQLVVPGLTSVNQESMEPALDLASEIEQVSPTVWDVTVREDARFGDGTAVTAADVVFTYQTTLDPEVKSIHHGGMLKKIVKVEAVDRLTARFHLVAPLGTFRSDLGYGIVSARAADPKRKRFAGGRVVGAGPYRAISWHPERVRLERNPHYHGEPAKMPRLDVRTVRDSNARALMLVGGSADFVQNSVRSDLVASIAKRKRVQVISGPSALLSYLMMQNRDPILDDVRVRRAIAHGIDRERIINAKFGGRARLATGLIPPGHWAYNGDVARYEFDPDKARRLLDEAGFPDPDGPGGQPRMRLSYKTSADQFRLAVARIIADQLGQIGISVEVRAFEFGTFFQDVKKGNYQLASMQTASITEPDYYFWYFHSSNIPTPKILSRGNRWRYHNPEADRYIAEGRRESDREKRRAAYAKVQELVARDVPIVPLWHEDNVAVMNRDVRGYALLPNAQFARVVGVTKDKR